MGMYCVKCGKELGEEDKFCLNCGVKIESKTQDSTQISSNISNSTQSGNYQLTQLKKSNMKLILTLATTIIIIIVIVVLLIAFGGNSDNRFIGSWAIQSSGGTSFSGNLIFEANGDLKTEYQGAKITVGKWNINESKICLEITIIGSTIPEICCSYSFSNGGNTLYLLDPTGGANNIVLTR